MISSEKENVIIKQFKQKKVMTIVELSVSMGCSLPTIRKRLKKWRTYTSYNKNNRYYTLPQIPQFNDYGIWNYQGIRFSRFGTLKQTVIELVISSNGGLTAAEISFITGVDTGSYMTYLRDVPEICREKMRGRYIYFAGPTSLYKCQKQIREWEEYIGYTAIKHLIKNESADSIDKQNHPYISINEILSRLREKGKTVSKEEFEKLLDYYIVRLGKIRNLLHKYQRRI